MVKGCIEVVARDDGRGELLCALEDGTDGGLSLADPLGEKGKAIDDLNVGAALASDSAREQRLVRARGAGEIGPVECSSR